METVKEETGADGRKKIYLRYTDQELAEMKKSAERKPWKKKAGGKKFVDGSFFGKWLKSQP